MNSYSKVGASADPQRRAAGRRAATLNLLIASSWRRARSVSRNRSECRRSPPRLRNSSYGLNISTPRARAHTTVTQLAAVKTAEHRTNPFPTLTKDNLKTVNDALKLAREMTKDKKCDEALKADWIPSLAALINGMTANGNVFDGRTSTLTGPPLSRLD